MATRAFKKGRSRGLGKAQFSLNEPTPDPSQEGNRIGAALPIQQFPSWEGSGVGSPDSTATPTCQSANKRIHDGFGTDTGSPTAFNAPVF